MRISSLVAGALAALCIAGPVPAADDAGEAHPGEAHTGEAHIDPAYRALLIAQFRRIAFRAETGGDHRAGRLVRWEQPVRVRVIGDDDATHLREVNHHLRVLARVTGHDIRMIRQGEIGKENIRVFILPEAEVLSLGRGGECFVDLFDDGRRASKAAVFVSREIGVRRRHCIVEELTQAMGLMADSDLFGESIFNEQSCASRLLPWDEAMLRVLYDKRLRTGMTLAEAFGPAQESITAQLEALARRAGGMATVSYRHGRWLDLPAKRRAPCRRRYRPGPEAAPRFGPAG